ncbi:MAG: response regulator [Oscillatoriales cyanobacterium RM2_1_1]|nr:response regulator [Oscillatoriales cyanobacterium SM2_3_0]NJO45994.1 response regulator [Oscillatoriales cyanobacterium RM2_1_1]
MVFLPQPQIPLDILIVDDTPANLRLLSKMMAEYGYNVRQAISGKMALIAVKTAQPDLILLDINMPEMSGYEVCEQLKKDEVSRSIPVIFLSALDDALDKVKAFRVGGVDYITKPFQFEEVIARIQNQLSIKQLQVQLQQQNQQLQETLDELQHTQARLVQQQKMEGLTQFVAGIAHEINNPVSFISGNLEPATNYIQDLLNLIQLYQTEYPDPTQLIQEFTQDMDLNFIISDLDKLISSMRTGVDRIRTIVLALRIFSRLDESEIKAVDLHEGLNSTLVLLQHKLCPLDQDKPEIQVVRDYGNLPLVTCHASQLNQVFFNIINNAIEVLEAGIGDQFPPQALPTIWILTELNSDNTVKISIKDNGWGISEEIKPRLFTPFFTTKPVGKGAGLGLLTSYQIVVQKHRGKLDVESSRGAGARFTIQIPIHLSKVS